MGWRIPRISRWLYGWRSTDLAGLAHAGWWSTACHCERDRGNPAGSPAASARNRSEAQAEAAPDRRGVGIHEGALARRLQGDNASSLIQRGAWLEARCYRQGVSNA